MLLVLNAGSSSLKFAVHDLPAGEPPAVPAWRGLIDGIGGRACLQVGAAGADPVLEPLAQGLDQAGAVAALLAWLSRTGLTPRAIAHRVVHGGRRFAAPVRIDAGVLAALAELVPLAPLHQPVALAAIAAISRQWPDAVQVACFDTAFHHGIPELESSFALPVALREQGIRRYGFHGLSCEHALGELRRRGSLPERLVVAHLGSGASLSAVRDGHSVATTMGFTALDGLPMAHRCGALDPGVLLYLQQQGWDAARISHLLYEESGLLGLSGLSGDVRELQASTAPAARFALELFCYRIGRELGALAAVLGGLDALVFTGGIGEHAPAVRARIAGHAAWLGLQLDARANEAGASLLSAPGSAVRAWRIVADEEGVMARHAAALLRAA